MDGPSTPMVKRWRYESTTELRRRDGVHLRGCRIGLLLAAIAVVLAALGTMLSWLHPAPRPVYLPLCIANYQKHELRFIHAHGQESLALPFTHAALPTQLDKRALLGELEKAAKLSARDSVVLYVSGHALCGDQGQVQILPADASLDDPTTWLPLRAVLEKLKACKSRQKLLVLDIMRPWGNGRQGILADETSAAVEHELAEVPDHDRLVLCACAAGQTACTAAELGRSVFAHYFAEALRGQADGAYTGEADGLVTVKEAAVFLGDRVDRWARHNRGCRQTPVLFGKTDFALAALPATPLSPYIPSAKNVAGFHLPVLRPRQSPREAPTYPEWLRDAWRQRDQWLGDGSYRLLPHLFQQHQALLLAAEEHAGFIKDEECKRHFVSRLKSLEKAINDGKRLTQLPPVSLVQAAEQGMVLDAKAAEAVQQFLPRWQQETAGAKPAEVERLRERMLEEFHAEAKGCSDFALAAAVFQRALASDCSTADLQVLDALLIRPGQPQPKFAETLLLRHLAAVNSAARPQDQAYRARVALQACVKCQRLTGRPDIYPWVAKLIDEPLQSYHDGEVRLAAHEYANLEAAHELFVKADASCDELLASADKIARARRTLDQALLVLPAFLPYLDHAPELQHAWEEAALAARDLHVFLGSNLAQAASIPTTEAARFLKESGEAFEQHALKLRVPLEQLHKPFSAESRAELKKRSEAEQADAAVYQQLATLLSIPHPHVRAEDRADLWQAARKLAARLHDQTDQALLAAVEAERDDNDVERPFRRARAAIALLELIGVESPDLQTLVDSLGEIQRHPKGPTWAGLGQAIRNLWNKRLDALATGKCPAEEQGLTLWMMPPFAANAEAGKIEDCATLAALRDGHALLRGWQGQHYRYLGRDYQGLGLKTPNIDAASAFWNQAASHHPGEPVPACAELDVQIAAVDLRHPASEAKIKVTRTQSDGNVRPLSIEVLDAEGDGIDIAPRRIELPEGTVPQTAVADERTMLVKLAASTGAKRRAGGFLLRVGYGDHFFHHVVPTPFAVAEQVQAVLCTDPHKPFALKEIRLTPKEPCACYLAVSNSSAAPRSLWLEIADAGKVLKRLPLTLQPFELKKATWNDEEQTAAIVGPLKVRVLDQDGKQILDSQEIPLVVESRKDGSAPALRLSMPPSQRSDDKVAVQIFAEHAPLNATMEVRLERPGGWQTSDEAHDETHSVVLGRFDSGRNVRFEATWSSDSALLFTATVRDWSVDVDTRLLAGDYLVRARLIDPAGNTLGEIIDKLHIADRRVRIIDPPDQALQGSAVELKALARDAKGDIASVQFFLGVPEAGKIPARTASLTARPVNAAKTFWTAHLRLPEDRKGLTPITVAATNRAGETTFDTINLNVAEGERSALGRIDGKVVEGARPQPGLTVQLLDEGGREVDRQTTTADGAYTFRNLAPGRYRVQCNKPASRRRAQLAVTVEANKKSDAPLALGL